MLKVSSGAFSITTYLLLRWEYAQMTSDEHASPEKVIALPSHHFNGGQHLSFPTGTLWSPCCRCHFPDSRDVPLNPDKSEIHRASVPPVPIPSGRPGLGTASSF